MGDRVLIEFAKILKKTLREVDIVGRYGGDEFIVCPLRADTEESKEIVKKIKWAAKNIKIKTEENDGLITISFTAGIYNCMPKKEKRMKINEIIHLADTRLLESKRETKSSFVVS